MNRQFFAKMFCTLSDNFSRRAKKVDIVFGFYAQFWPGKTLQTLSATFLHPFAPGTRSKPPCATTWARRISKRRKPNFAWAFQTRFWIARKNLTLFSISTDKFDQGTTFEIVAKIPDKSQRHFQNTLAAGTCLRPPSANNGTSKIPVPNAKRIRFVQKNRK